MSNDYKGTLKSALHTLYRRAWVEFWV